MTLIDALVYYDEIIPFASTKCLAHRSRAAVLIAKSQYDKALEALTKAISF